MTKIKVSHVKPEKKGYFTRQVEAYLKKKSSFTYPRSRVIRPSSISQCIRYNVCDILGLIPAEEINAQQQRIFDNGDSVHHRYLKSYLPRIGIAAKILTHSKTGKQKIKDFIEVSLRDDEYWIKCRPDAVIRNHEDGLNYVLEIKSIKHDLFIELDKPSDAYLQQVHLYMFVTKTPRAIVFYEDKDTQKTKEFVIEQDDKLLDQLLEKIRTIQRFVVDYINDNKLPECCNKPYCYACRTLEV